MAESQAEITGDAELKIALSIIEKLSKDELKSILEYKDFFVKEALHKQRTEILTIGSNLIDERAITENQKVNTALIKYYMELRDKIKEMGAGEG